MPQLLVTANRLNKRNRVPVSLPDSTSIIGVVNKGFSFEGNEVAATAIPNPSLGKWYQDRDGSLYWGGGLIVESVSFPGLPVNLPLNFRLGVDVSHHNGNPDWNAFKSSGASFAFIKISEGVGARDKMAKQNADDARSKGLKIGYYHFCHPDTTSGGAVVNDATAEANEALQTMEGLPKPDLPLVLDLEDWNGGDSILNKADYLLWVTTFLNRIKDQTGTDSIIYSRKEYLDRKLPTNHGLGTYKLWLSFYPDKPDYNKTACPVGWNDWAIWQYTAKGAIGTSAVLDINILKDSTLF